MLDSDPLIKLKSQELDLTAQDDFRKKEETEARINMDKSKLMQARDLTEQKLEQNEDLAELRADTSLEKQAMANRAKMKSDLIKRKDVKTLKGPQS